MAEDADISTIVRSTIDLGHNLGLKVVAEGVEDLQGWNLLARLGCDEAQGYYMSPPLEAEALKTWIRSYHESTAAESAPVAFGGRAEGPRLAEGGGRS